MSSLAEIEPKRNQRVIDLIRAAGIDVSDWANYKKGKSQAASNPKYCYEWSYVESGKVVVLNLWFASMQVGNGAIWQSINMRKHAEHLKRYPNKSVWVKRAIHMDAAIQKAVKDYLPVRVVICEGKMRDPSDPKANASSVQKRLLDPVVWAVTDYVWETGECILTRGGLQIDFVDQFSIEEEVGAAERRLVTGETFVRSNEVRAHVLLRAQGRCEFCGQPGFKTSKGKVFLETHHVIPLFEGGTDRVSNAVALCPNHHREAHHGVNAGEIRKTCINRFSKT